MVHFMKNYKPIKSDGISGRFWSKVNISEKKKCWNWKMGDTSKNPAQNYGRIWIDGIAYRAHRIAYKLFYNTDPGKMLVCHRCDNPRCCNPHHLFLGTHTDNQMDCEKKNRANKEKGEDRYNAILSDDDVRFIRKNYAFRGIGGMTGKELAKKFKIGRTMISAIVNRRRWKHVQ